METPSDQIGDVASRTTECHLLAFDKRKCFTFSSGVAHIAETSDSGETDVIFFLEMVVTLKDVHDRNMYDVKEGEKHEKLGEKPMERSDSHT